MPTPKQLADAMAYFKKHGSLLVLPEQPKYGPGLVLPEPPKPAYMLEFFAYEQLGSPAMDSGFKSKYWSQFTKTAAKAPDGEAIPLKPLPSETFKAKLQEALKKPNKNGDVFPDPKDVAAGVTYGPTSKPLVGAKLGAGYGPAMPEIEKLGQKHLAEKHMKLNQDAIEAASEKLLSDMGVPVEMYKGVADVSPTLKFTAELKAQAMQELQQAELISKTTSLTPLGIDYAKEQELLAEEEAYKEQQQKMLDEWSAQAKDAKQIKDQTEILADLIKDKLAWLVGKPYTAETHKLVANVVVCELAKVAKEAAAKQQEIMADLQKAFGKFPEKLPDPKAVLGSYELESTTFDDLCDPGLGIPYDEPDPYTDEIKPVPVEKTPLPLPPHSLQQGAALLPPSLGFKIQEVMGAAIGHTAGLAKADFK